MDENSLESWMEDADFNEYTVTVQSNIWTCWDGDTIVGIYDDAANRGYMEAGFCGFQMRNEYRAGEVV